MKGKVHILCSGCEDKDKIASGDCQAVRSRVIYIPALRQGRTGTGGKADRPRAGKGLRKKSLTAPRRSGKVLPRAERRKGGRRKAAGGDPAGGNLENRILDRRNHFLLSIQPVKPVQKGRYGPGCPGFTISFSFYVKIAGWIPSRSSPTESLLLAQDERWRRA